MPQTQAQINAHQREYRKETGDKHTKAYEKSPRGFLMRTYRNMKSRVTGVQHKKAHLYKGLPILDKDTFYAWSWDSHDFWRLYRRWVDSGFDRKLSPSINRINSKEGYLLGNIEWLTHSANSSLGAYSPKRHHNMLLEVYEHTKA